VTVGKLQPLKIVTSVAPYVIAANALEAIELAHADGFSGVELDEDHLHRTVKAKPASLGMMREYGDNKHMINSLHKTLFRPSIDSENPAERRKAVDFTLKTLDYMESVGIRRMVLHSFSDLPAFFTLKTERANKLGYPIGQQAVKVYGVLAPVLKAYRKTRQEKIESCFMQSLTEIARYAADKKVDGEPIEIVFEEHYSDAIDYDKISYGKGNLSNVVRGIDTAHHLIRTGKQTDLSEIACPIHFHAVDTGGRIDDHRALGTGKVQFGNILTEIAERKLTNTVVIENGTRRGALTSKEMLAPMIKRLPVKQ
jgi:sugar phosphate isomerase/epimerase